MRLLYVIQLSCYRPPSIGNKDLLDIDWLVQLVTLFDFTRKTVLYLTRNTVFDVLRNIVLGYSLMGQFNARCSQVFVFSMGFPRIETSSNVPLSHNQTSFSPLNVYILICKCEKNSHQYVRAQMFQDGGTVSPVNLYFFSDKCMDIYVADYYNTGTVLKTCDGVRAQQITPLGFNDTDTHARHGDGEAQWVKRSPATAKLRFRFPSSHTILESVLCLLPSHCWGHKTILAHS